MVGIITSIGIVVSIIIAIIETEKNKRAWQKTADDFKEWAKTADKAEVEAAIDMARRQAYGHQLQYFQQLNSVYDPPNWERALNRFVRRLFCFFKGRK